MQPNTQKLIRIIYSRYIFRQNILQLSDECRQALMEQYRRFYQQQITLDETTFDNVFQ